jgi:CubicO group peptidase (beta-lactamase class C family)
VSVAAIARLLDEAEGVVAPCIAAVVTGRDPAKPLYLRRPDAVFDLASLTKPLATTEVAVRAIAAGALELDGMHALLPRGVRIRDLLQHASGWPAHRDFATAVPATVADRRAAIVRAALATPLDAPPGCVHVYSDVGFLALGAVLESVLGAPMDALFARAWPSHPFSWGHRASEPTDGSRGGPVNDGNARAMGGIAPHAGLFGTAPAVARACARWRDGEVPGAAAAFATRGPGSHALGWDTASTDGTSTAGARPPSDTVGHLGYTGTSCWMSPSQGRIAVLLTNRVATTLDPAPVRALRRAFHQLAWELPEAAP